MQLFLIRHAQSQNNAVPESERIEDPGLTELGHRQAEQLAERIQELEFTQLHTSPFLRTLETTEYIRQATGLVPRIRVELHELGGCVSGAPPGQLVGESGLRGNEITRAFPNYQHDVPESGWWQCKPYETYELASHRAEQLVQLTCEEFADSEERVGYVMHADIKRIFLSQFHSDSLQMPYNAAVTHVVLESTTLRLVDYNCVKHLQPGELSV